MIVRLAKERHFPALRHRQRLLRVLRAAQQLIGLDQWPGILQINLVSAKTIAAINEDTLRHQGPTDVLTFDWRQQMTNGQKQTALGCLFDDEPEIMAEIYLCPEVALENATEYGNTPSHELILYAVHGMLHLHGYNDQNQEQQKKMRAAEAAVLAQLQKKHDLNGFIC